MNYIVDACPITKFVGELNLLHEADDDAVIWLESAVTAALNEINNNVLNKRHCCDVIITRHRSNQHSAAFNWRQTPVGYPGCG